MKDGIVDLILIILLLAAVFFAALLGFALSFALFGSLELLSW